MTIVLIILKKIGYDFVYLYHKVFNMKTIGIYKITSPSGKVYIGQSIDLDKRFEKYKKLHCKGQIRLYASFIKHGVENHLFEIIKKCSARNLNIIERFYQEKFNCIGSNGLNCRLTNSFDKSGELSKEMKEKLSANRKGMKFSKEHCKNIGLSKTGVIMSDATKRKMSLAKKNKEFSLETKRKLSETQHLKRIVLDLSTGIFYDSITEAAFAYNINVHILTGWLSGKRKNKSNLMKV